MSNLERLDDIFKNRIFRIPDYQRGYAWTDKNLYELWEDIDLLQDGRFHYTGMLSLSEIKDHSKDTFDDIRWLLDNRHYKLYHIVDGQQRLTTLLILINEILNLYKSINPESNIIGYEKIENIIEKYIIVSNPKSEIIKSYVFGYEKDNPSFEYFVNVVLNDNNNESLDTSTYTKNLLNAKDFFKRELLIKYNDFGIEKIDEIFQKVTSSLMLNINYLDDEYDVFVAFETMNNRGKPLSTLELLKNRLIYLSTLYNKDEYSDAILNLRKGINKTWKKIYYYLGKNPNKKLSDDDFLRDHWTIYFTYSRKKANDFKPDLLNKRFTAKNVASTEKDKLLIDDIYKYVTSLSELIEPWYFTFFPNEIKSKPIEHVKWLDKISRVGVNNFRALLTTLINKNDEEDNVLEIYKSIERFQFVAYRLCRCQTSYGSSEIYRQTRKLYANDPETSIFSIKKDIDNRIDDWPSPSSDFQYNKLLDSLIKNYKYDKGYYGLDWIKYFFYEYELDLIEKHGFKQKIDWELFKKSEKDKVSIEHILPQNPDSDWDEYFNKKTKKFSYLVNSFGNLVPLSLNVNSRLQNHSFDRKKEGVYVDGKLHKRGFKDGTYSEREISQNEVWTEEKIINRGKELFNFMAKRWNINISKDIVDELLFISEINSEDSSKIISKSSETIGKFVINFFEEAAHFNYFDEIDLENLQNKVFSKQVFNSNLSILINDEKFESLSKDEDLYQRYYKNPYTFNGEVYYLSSQWISSQFENLIMFVNNIKKENM